MQLPWTATLTTDDGILIQQIDVTAVIAPYRDAGTVTDDIMVVAVYVEHRQTPFSPAHLSQITGPLATVLAKTLEADAQFCDRARDCLPPDDTARDPHRANRRNLVATSGVRFGRF